MSGSDIVWFPSLQGGDNFMRKICVAVMNEPVWVILYHRNVNVLGKWEINKIYTLDQQKRININCWYSTCVARKPKGNQYDAWHLLIFMAPNSSSFRKMADICSWWADYLPFALSSFMQTLLCKCVHCFVLFSFISYLMY